MGEKRGGIYKLQPKPKPTKKNFQPKKKSIISSRLRAIRPDDNPLSHSWNQSSVRDRGEPDRPFHFNPSKILWLFIFLFEIFFRVFF